MNFKLNLPALQTAGQILNQQCLAAAQAEHQARHAGVKKAPPAPGADDLISDAIDDLIHAGRAHRAHVATPGAAVARPIAEPRALLEQRLAGAAAHIFHIAAANDIDLGSAIATHLETVATAA